MAERGGEVLWGQLTGLLRPWWRRITAGQPHLAFEYAWSSDGLTVRLWLPAAVPTALVRRAVEAAWPGAHTRLTKPTTPIRREHVSTAGRLRLARPDILPLRTDHDADPLRALLQAATGMETCETAVVQIVARPATGARLRRARHAARRMKAGANPRRLSALFDLLTHTPQRTHTTAFDPAHHTEVRQVVNKLAGPQWEVAIRYAVALTSDIPQAQERLRGRAHALASAFSLFAARNWLARARLPHADRMLSGRWFPARGDLLSVPELACLAHLPADPDAPGLARAGARSLLPPPAIPTPGPGVKPLGRSDAGRHREVGLHIADARHHLHLMGATGSGKSTLIAQMVLYDVAAGRGAVVIDPKGDLVTDLLHRLPDHCADRLVLLDPDDPHTPPCLNVLEGADIDVLWGRSGYHDAEQERVRALLGTNFADNRGNVTLSGDFSKSHGLVGTDRPIYGADLAFAKPLYSSPYTNVLYGQSTVTSINFGGVPLVDDFFFAPGIGIPAPAFGVTDSNGVLLALPYFLTLLVLALQGTRTRAPAALGMPWQSDSR